MASSQVSGKFGTMDDMQSSNMSIVNVTCPECGQSGSTTELLWCVCHCGKVLYLERPFILIEEEWEEFKSSWHEVWYYLFGAGQDRNTRIFAYAVFPFSFTVFVTTSLLARNCKRLRRR